MTFANPVFLQLGAGIVLLVALGYWSHARRRRRLAAFLGGRRGAARLSRADLYRPRLGRLLLTVTAVMALAIAGAEPRLPAAEVPDAPPPPRIHSVVVAIDVSASMQARDEAPSRLGRAVDVARELIAGLEGSRVGLLLYAGTAYPLAPPTHDHAALAHLFDGVTPTIASAYDPGSSPSAGIREALRLLALDTDSSAIRSIVLISDGESGEAATVGLAAVREAAASGVTLHAIGVGTTAGAGITMPATQFQAGGPVLGPSGEPVLSRLGESSLRALSDAAAGSYVHASDDPGLYDLTRSFVTLVRVPTLESAASEAPVHDLTYWLALAALVILLVESLLDVRLPLGSPVPAKRPW